MAIGKSIPYQQTTFMKQTLVKLLPAILCFFVLVTSCKKDKEPSKDTTPEIEIGTHADDGSMVAEEIDAIATDVNTLVEADASLSGDASVVDEAICDASVAFNLESDPMTITVTFNGAACGIKRKRTGVVVLSMAKGSHWKDQGTAITVTYQNFKVTRNYDKKSILINGTQTYTNVSGGLLYQTASLGSIIHRISSDALTIKFDDGTARTWSVARQKEFTYNNGLVITVTGTHSAGNEEGIAEWGTNRFGTSFTTSITSPLVVKQDCDFRITSGAIRHKTDAYIATATFGLNATGEATACPGSGNYFYQLGWTNIANGNNFTVILPY